MEIDKFGRTSIHLQRKHKLNENHVEYNVSEVNVKKRRVTNLQPPMHINDAASKEYVDQQVADFKTHQVSSETKQLQIILEDTLNANNCKITNLGDAAEDTDAVNLKVTSEIFDAKIMKEKLKLKTILQNDIFGMNVNQKSVESETGKAQHPVKNINLYLWLSKWLQEK
jgi:hypothetical protein